MEGRINATSVTNTKAMNFTKDKMSFLLLSSFAIL